MPVKDHVNAEQDYDGDEQSCGSAEYAVRLHANMTEIGFFLFSVELKQQYQHCGKPREQHVRFAERVESTVIENNA